MPGLGWAALARSISDSKYPCKPAYDTLSILHGDEQHLETLGGSVIVSPGEPIQAGTDSATGPGGNMIWVLALPSTK